MPFIRNYKLIVRNIETNEINAFRIEKKDVNDSIKEVDNELAAFESKKNYLETLIGDVDPDKYDTYIAYNTKSGYKFFDTYFEHNLANDEYRKKMAKNIISCGLSTAEFQDFIEENYGSIKQQFEHRKDGELQYNNLEMYLRAQNDHISSDITRFGKVIESHLLEDYLQYRKLVDIAFRFKNKKLIELDESRKRIDYSPYFNSKTYEKIKEITFENGSKVKVNVFNFSRKINLSTHAEGINIDGPVEVSKELKEIVKEKNEEKEIVNVCGELLDILCSDKEFIENDMACLSTMYKTFYVNCSVYYETRFSNDSSEHLKRENKIRTKLSNDKKLRLILSKLIIEYKENLKGKDIDKNNVL